MGPRVSYHLGDQYKLGVIDDASTVLVQPGDVAGPGPDPAPHGGRDDDDVDWEHAATPKKPHTKQACATKLIHSLSKWLMPLAWPLAAMKLLQY